MSWKGNLIKAGISSDGKSIDIFRGNLTVYGNITLTGGGSFVGAIGGDQTRSGTLTMTATDTAMIMSGAAALGLSLTGSYTTAGIQVGSNSVPIVMAAYNDYAIDINTTCAVASNSGTPINAFRLKSVTTGTQSEDWTMAVESLTNIYSGNENTVGHFYSNWGTTSGIGPLGMASAVTAKMLLPTSCTGAFFAFYGKMNMPASPAIMDPAVGAGNSAGWFMLSTGGVAGGITSFSNYGRFMEIHNIVAGTDKMLSLTGQTLRCAVPNASTIRYLMLSQLQDGLGLGVTGTPMVLTAATDRAVAIFTTCSLSTGTVTALQLKTVLTGVATEAISRAATFHVNAGVKIGTNCTVADFHLEFDDVANIGTAGLGSAITARVTLGAANVYGAYFPIYAKLGFASSGQTGLATAGTGGSSAGWMLFSLEGEAAGKTNFSDNGLFMEIHNITAGTGKLLSLNGQTLRCAIPDATTLRYMMLSQAEDYLSLSRTLTSNADHILDLTVASTATGASVQPISMVHTMTGATAVGGRALFEVDANAALGGWVSAIKGYLNFNSSGSVTGLGAAVLAETNMPAQSITTGSYTCIECELTCPSLMAGLGSHATSFIYMKASGNNVSSFQTSGFLFDIWGVGSAGLFQSANQAGLQVDATLAIRVDGVTYYLGLCDTNTGG